MKKLTLKWLRLHIDFYEQDVLKLLEQIDLVINTKGMEIEEVKFINPLLVTKIINFERREGLKVSICQTKINSNILKYLEYPYPDKEFQVLCGASNPRAGINVVLAPIGTKIGDFTIAPRQIKGQDSFGMFCSMREIGEEENNDRDEIIESNLPEGTIYKYDDVFIKIANPTNRWDLMTVRGIARELSNANLGVFKELPCHFGQLPLDISVHSDVGVSAAFVQIQNIQINPQIKQFLDNIGEPQKSDLKYLNDFILQDIGHPIHIYDANEVKQINLRRAKSQENFITLKNENYITKDNEIIIEMNKQSACIGGTIGIVGFNDITKHVIIEAIYFLPENINQLITESAKLFHLGIDHEQETIGYVCSLIFGDISTCLRTKGNTIEKPEICLRYSQFYKTTDLSMSIDNICNHLKKYGFLASIDRKKRDDNINDEYSVVCQIPSWRTDIGIPEDLIEEILRISSMDPYLNVLPRLYINKNLQYNDINNKIRDCLISNGFTELYNFPFTNYGEIQITNPLNSEKSFLRNSLLPSMVDCCIETKANGYDFCLFFEIGKIYLSPDREMNKLGILIQGEDQRTWDRERQEFNFFYLKQILLKLSKIIHIDLRTSEPLESNDFDFGLRFSNGHIGKIMNKQQNKHLNNVFFAEVSIESKIISGCFSGYKPVQKKLYRDMSITLPKHLSYKEISQNISVYHYLFDYFPKDDEISYGITLIFLPEQQDQIEDKINQIKNKLLTLK